MFSPQSLETCLSPSRRFLTTYTHDFQPFVQRHPQSKRGTWPNLHGSYYETPSQPLRSGLYRSQISDSILPVVTRPFSLPTLRKATWEAQYTPTNAWTQEAIIPRESRLLSGEDKRSQHHPVWGNEGMLVWVSPLGHTSFADFMKSYFRRDRLERPFNLPAKLSPDIISKDAEREHSGILWDFSRCTGVKDYPSHPPAFTKCRCCALEYEHPHHSVAHCSFLPQGHIQPIHHCMEHRHTPQLTEHQASYSAPWFRPKNQMGVFLQHLPH